jgi:radical SAM protein with 4Fe4S-binding SPASM domain
MVTRVKKTENYAILLAKKRLAGETIPSVVTWEVTYRCNLRCRHCYLGPYTHGGESPHDELSTAEMCDLLEQMFKAGTFFVDFTGGELFCRPDIFEIMEHAKKIGLFFGIKTNATLITEAVADRLKELGVSGVHVSLYGGTAAAHEFVTQVPGSFDRTVNAIRLLKEREIRLAINVTMMKCNAGEHKKIKELGKELGVNTGFTPIIFPVVGQPGSADEIRMDDDQFKKLIIDLDWVPDDKYLTSSNLEHHILCSAGRIRCAISPVGEVIPCVTWRLPLGDLRKQSFQDIWYGEAFDRVRAIGVSDLPVCAKCELARYCARCPGLIQLENDNGGASGPSSVNCRMARALKEVRDAHGKESLH